MYSTESGETSHKIMIKESYWRSNRNDASHEIRRTYARLDILKIDKINIQADLPCPIQDKVWDKHNKGQVGLVARQLQGFTATIDTVSQSNHDGKVLPDLLID